MSYSSTAFRCLLGLLCMMWLPALADEGKLVTLTFDELSIGEYLTDQYRTEGVVFSGTYEPSFGISGAVATQGVAGTMFFGNSEPNFVIVGLGSLTATFVDPRTGDPAQASYVSFRIGDGEPNPEIAGVNAFDENGSIIFSQVIHMIDQGTTVEIRSPAGRIAQVRMFGLYPPIPSGFNMDDLHFKLSQRSMK